MCRLIYVFLLAFGLTINAFAQKPVFGNEWINYQQTYYKIPIAQKGLYRLTASELQKAGLPATLDPRALQLFHRGTEQAIWVEGEADGKLDAADYLDFIGQGADGVGDSTLYRPQSAQPHPHYNLYTDTTAYFLTLRLDGQPGKRIVRAADPGSVSGTAGLTPFPFVQVEDLRVLSDTYPAGNIYPMGAWYGNGAILTSFDVGESWMGPSIKPKTTYSQTISLARSVTALNSTPTLELLLIGRTPTNHSVQVRVGPPGRQRTLDLLEWANYDTKTLTIPLSASETTGDIVCSFSPQHANDEVSLALLRATYPHVPSMSGYTYREFRLPSAASGRGLLQLTNVPATGRVFDITTPGQTSLLSGTLVNGTFTSVVADANVVRKMLYVNEVRSVPSLQRVTFRNLNPAKVNFAIVAHPTVRQPIAESPDVVASYAAYRASKAGGSYDTLTVNSHQLYNQFNYGERSPLAIRRFADYLARGGAGTKHLLLVGRSVDHQGVRKNPFADTLDMIPNGGWPGSDVSIITGIAGKPAYVPGIAIGRLNVTQPRQVLDYLNKLKEHEAAPPTALWRKQMLHLSGGRSAYELSLFRAFMDDFGRSITGKYVCANVETVAKQTDNPTEDIPINQQINRGIGMLSMFGHSSLDVADINIGYVSNDRLGYRNKGRYPILLGNGCASGNFYYYVKGFRTFVTDWVLTPDRGAILALAHTHNGFVGPLKNYADQLYAVMADSAWVGRTFGEIQVEAVGRYVAQNQSIFDKANAEQIVLQGDPAVRPFPFTKPDLSFSESGIQVRSANNVTTLRAVALNLGRGTARGAEVRVRAYDDDGRLLVSNKKRVNTAAFADTLTVALNVPATVNPYFEFYADPDGLLDEERRDNNILRFDNAGKVADVPFQIDNTPPVVEVAFDGRRIRNDELVAPQAAIEVLLADENTKLALTAPPTVELYLQRPCAQQPCPFERLATTQPAANWTKRGSDWLLTYRPPTPLPAGTYTLEAYGSDLTGNRAQPYTIRFTVRPDRVVTDVAAGPNPFSYQTAVRYTLAGSQSPQPAILRLFDLTGREVRTLTVRSVIGTNEVVWDGNNGFGAAMPSGTYLYQLDLPGYDAFENGAKQKLTGKLVLVR